MESGMDSGQIRMKTESLQREEFGENREPPPCPPPSGDLSAAGEVTPKNTAGAAGNPATPASFLRPDPRARRNPYRPRRIRTVSISM
jgi:hypothetical protein